MAEIYALPISDHSTTDTEFRKELLKKHKENEIMSYDLALNKLKEHGTEINQKWKKDSIKKIEKELYELRSKNVRTLLYFDGNNFFIILHSFLKTTQKTPKIEITKALKEIKRWKQLKESN